MNSTLKKSLARGFALAALASLMTVMSAVGAQAQWTTSGTNTTTTNNVGVGTTAPERLLEVSAPSTGTLPYMASAATISVRNPDNTTANNTADLSFRTSDTAGTAATAAKIVGIFTSRSTGSVVSGDIALVTNNAGTASEKMRVTSVGNVGIGTIAPAYKFEISGSASRNTFAITNDGDSVGYAGIKLQPFTKTGIAANRTSEFNLHMRKDGWYSGDASGPSFIIETVSTAGGFAAPFMISPNNDVILNGGRGASGLAYGNVGIGTTAPASKLHVVGDITVTGNINAKYQDVAEWVPSTQKLIPGTVVVLDTRNSNHVLASKTSYDARVAGVVSAQPGLTLGEAGEGKALIATTGRVKVKVDASRAPIQIGDLLVTSDVEGVAMKSEPINIGGRQMHAPGTIIGKALEPLAKGAGEILVLLSLQ